MPWKEVSTVQEPEDYDPTAKKIDDPVAYYRHKEAAVVEQYVKVAEAKLWRRKLKECYLQEGVDHLTQCKELATKYLESIKGVGFYKANAGRSDEPRYMTDRH